MSSEEADKKSVEENTQETASSAEENDEKEEVKEDKVNNKAAKKKAAEPPKIKQPAKKRVKTEQAEKDKKEDKKEEKEKKKAEKEKEKEKEEEEEEEEEDEEEEGSAEENDVENHKVVPLLDQPLEISGSRKRKEVQRFKPVEPDEDSKEIKIPKGKGKALGEIAIVEFNLQRAKPEDLKLLHRLCFGKPGKAAVLKKNLKKFNGYEFDEESEEFEKKKSLVAKSFKKVFVAHLKNVCNIIAVEKNGTRDDILDRILKFLAKPVDSGKKLPGSGRSKRSGASSKNYDEGDDSFKSNKKKGTSKGKKKDKDSEDSESEKEDSEKEDVKENDKEKDDEQTTEESEPEEEKEKEEEKPKKGAKKGKKAAEAADKKAPPKKRAAAKKVVEKKSDTEGDADEESEDEEPLAKKTKAPPTDEEIKTYVKTLLEGANLELITMKKVCQDVYAHYPDFDLGHKKEFIKTTVKSLISS